ncbi:MAG: helix-turn-helix domain-containing protein [Bacteroidota bacterium]
MPSGSTFEADLRAVRDAKGLSLDEIQHDTRIPVDVLKRFEAGQLVGDPTYNPVYLKAFLTSYAKAVSLPVTRVLTAYEAHQAGRYEGSLHPEYDPSARSAPAPPPEASASEAGASEAVRPENGPPAGASAPPAAATIPAVEALATSPPPEVARPVPEPPKTLAQVRVSRPSVPTARRSFDKNWGTILGLFAVLATVLAVVLWLLVFRDADSPETDASDEIAVGDAQTAAIDSAGVGAGAASGGAQFRLPIEVTVTAGGNGLQWFRVTEDAGDRTPHWIDQGTSQTFSADSALVFWGEGNDTDTALAFDEATLELQGQRFTPRSGSRLVISAQTGQALLDSLAAAGPSVP